MYLHLHVQMQSYNYTILQSTQSVSFRSDTSSMGLKNVATSLLSTGCTDL